MHCCGLFCSESKMIMTRMLIPPIPMYACRLKSCQCHPGGLETYNRALIKWQDLDNKLGGSTWVSEELKSTAVLAYSCTSKDATDILFFRWIHDRAAQIATGSTKTPSSPSTSEALAFGLGFYRTRRESIANIEVKIGVSSSANTNCIIYFVTHLVYIATGYCTKEADLEEGNSLLAQLF